MLDQTMIKDLRARPRSGADDRFGVRMLLHEALSRSRQHRAE
jgi:hypothetical protein